jgi:hypothetical protein
MGLNASSGAPMATLRKIKDSFQVDFYLYGERFRKNFGTKAQAQEFKNLIEYRFDTKETTIEKAIANYLEQETKQKLTKYSTEALYFWELKQYLKKELQISPQSFVSEIRPIHVRGFQNWLRSSDRPGGQLSNSTVNRRFNTLKHFFNKCTEWEFIRESPARFIRSLSETPKVSVFAVKGRCPRPLDEGNLRSFRLSKIWSPAMGSNHGPSP